MEVQFKMRKVDGDGRVSIKQVLPSEIDEIILDKSMDGIKKSETDSNSNSTLEVRTTSSAELEQDPALKKLSREMGMTNLMVDRPCCVLSVAFLFLIFIACIVMIFRLYVLNDFTSRDYLVWEDPKTWDYDKMNLVKQELLMETGDGKVPLQTQIDPYWITFLLYDLEGQEDTNLWTKDNLIAIREIEKEIRQDPTFE